MCLLIKFIKHISFMIQFCFIVFISSISSIKIFQVAGEKIGKIIRVTAPNEDRTHDPWFTRPVLCRWAMEAVKFWDTSTNAVPLLSY